MSADAHFRIPPDGLSPDPAADLEHIRPGRFWPIVAFLAFAIGLLTIGGLWFVGEKADDRKTAEDDLTVVVLLKSRAIANWAEERRGDAAALAFQLSASRQTRDWLETGAPGDGASEHVVRKLHALDVYKTYRDVTLFDGRGRALVSTSGAGPPPDDRLKPLIARTVTTGASQLTVLYGQTNRGDDDEIIVSAPVADADSGRAIGVVGLRVMRSAGLATLIRWWPGASPSAETRILDRLAPTAAPFHVGETSPDPIAARAASKGFQGALEGRDDRGVEVIAASAPIPNTPWVLIVERDASEVFARIQRTVVIVGGATAALVMSGGLLLIASRRREQAVLIARRTEAEARRQVLARGFEFLTRYANDIILLLDPRGAIADANERAVEAYLWPRDVLIGSAYESLDHNASEGDPVDTAGRLFESIHHRRDGTAFAVEISQRRIDIDGEVWRQLIIRDITERKESERRHQRVTRALATLSAGNIAMVRARTLDGLYQRMCDILVDTGGFRMAWVGMADHDAARTVRPVAFAGHEAGYLSLIKISWADVTHGRGPTGTAIREDRTRINSASSDEPRYGPWRAQALERGYQSSIALPLRDEGRVIGALTIYAAEADAFGRDEVALLEELAGDLSFGVVTLRERQMRDSLAMIVDSSRDAIFGVTLDGVITSWNSGAEAIYRFNAAEVVGWDIRLFVDTDTRATIERIFERARAGQAPEPFELAHTRRDGQPITVSVTGSLTFDLSGAVIGVAAITRDITEHKRIEAELIRAAQFDSLTGLLNRTAFTETVRRATAADIDGAPTIAVLFLNLDNFKDINDSLGYAAGDAVLKALSARLEALLVGLGVVARFGGDEFAMLLEQVNQSRIDAVARSVLDTVGEPLDVDGAEIRIGASVGVAMANPGAVSAEDLLSRADIALGRAKDEGRGLFRRFTEAMDVAVRRRVTLGRDLRSALNGGQLWLAYQPQVRADTGAIIGVEALARWSHPERGLIGPAEFIPISERIGLATPIGRWVIGEACRQIRLWLDMGLSPPSVAVNLSATQFSTPGDLERDLAAAMARYWVTPDRLELELTETVLMASTTDHGETLMRLRSGGFRLSIDDFGTGYSSLDYLRWFPADRIKIDQNFIKDIGSTPGAEAIVKAIISLARQLCIGVIAEGVETSHHRDLLRQWDCEEMQGYYFSRPVTADVITGFLKAGRRLPV